MQSYTQRVASFNASKGKSKAKSKIAWPFDPEDAPLLTPERMAEAGFYHSPSTAEGDEQCICYLCDLHLGGWENEDDPHAEHSRRGNCAWADMVCSVKMHEDKSVILYKTPGSLPSSAESSFTRLQTYRNWWPHESPTAESMANAGFVFYPAKGSNDQVTCPYCNYTLDGWDPDDDPVAVHLKRGQHCAFFNATMDPDSTASKSKSKATTSKRSKKTTKAVPTESHSEAEATQHEDEDVAAEEAIPSKSARKGRKPRGTTATAISAPTTAPSGKSASSRGRKKKGEEPVSVEEEASAAEEADAAIETDAPGVADPEAEEEDVAPKKKGRGRPKGASAKAKPPAKGKGRGKKKDASSSEEEDDELMEEDEADNTIIAPPPPPPAPEPSSKSSKATKSTKASRESKASAPPPPSLTLSEPSEPSSKPSRSAPSKSTKSTTSSKSEKPLPPSPPPPSPPAKAAPQRGKRSSALPKSSAPAGSRLALPTSTTTSELDRFANLPPTSPPFLDPGVTPKASSSSSSAPSRRPAQSKAKASPRLNLPREVLDQSLTSGAKEARKVMDEIINLSPFRSLSPGAEEKEMRLDLTDEQRQLTLTDLVQQTMQARKEALRKEGMAMIGAWEERTKEARRRLEAL